MSLHQIVATIAPDRHVLIAGPTASGKSALALAIAQQQGGVIVNADALQVWSCWRVISARPSAEDEAAAPHRLYGHMPPGAPWSVGAWLAQVADLLAGGQRLIVVGGTGLYLHALSHGLAVIPPVPPALRATGRGIADWQADTPPPLIPAAACQRIVLTSDRDWLAERIARRFHLMMDQGALDEVQAMLPLWDPKALWARAIGAPELVAHLRGEISRDAAVERAIIASRQYAKSQRIFFRGRMREWDQRRIGPAS